METASARGITVRHTAQRPLRTQLARGIALLALVVLGLLGLVLVAHHARGKWDEAAQRLSVASKNRAAAVDEYLDDHRKAVTILAAAMPMQGVVVPTERADAQLRRMHELFPGFLTMIVANSDGIVVAADPRTTFEGRDVVSLHDGIADREYFRAPMKSGTPFVSKAFRGRGFGSDPIVAVSAPVVRDGKPVALVEGSLNLKQFESFRNALGDIERVSILILDPDSKLVYSSGRVSATPLSNLADSPLVATARQAGVGETFSYERPGGGTFLVSASTARHGWRVFVMQPASVIEKEMVRDVVFTAAMVLLAAGFSLLLARRLASRVTSPLIELVGAVESLRQGVQRVELEVSETAPSEVTELMRGFTEMSADLADSEGELRRLLDREARLRSDLERERGELRVEVERRIAAQKELEQLNRDLAVARDQALEGSRAKSAFLANMSHELRTPLNSILGFSEILQEKLRERGDPRIVEQAGIINSAGKRLLSLVDDLLEIARLETGEIEIEVREWSIADVLQRALEAAIPTGDRSDVDLVVDIPGDLGSAPVDAEKLVHAVSELVSNAFKFTPKGFVRLAARAETREDGADLVVTVSDTGIGIPEGTLARVFEPFAQGDETLSRRFGGAGVGLAISNRLCQLMGGRIEVRSAEGRGSEFTIRIPVGRAGGS